MNDQLRARRNAVLLAGAVIACSVFLLTRGGSDEPVARPRRTTTSTVAVSATPGPIAAPAVTTTVAKTAKGPSTTTEEAAPRPATTPPAVPASDDASQVAVAFLRGWVLRDTIDARRAEMTKWAEPDYAANVAIIDDPDRLPPGNSIAVASVDVRGDLGATVVAHVDGIKIKVDLVRTGRGYLVENHAPIR